MKLLLATLVAVALLAAPSAATCGDIDDSGAIDVLDALLAAQSSASLVVLTPDQILAGDVNSSGAVEIIDALQIARHVTLLPVVLSCPAPAAEKIYVGVASPTQVVVVDHTSDTVVGTIAISHAVDALAADPVRDLVYVSSGTGSVSVIDTTTDAVSGSFLVPTLTGPIDVTPDGTTLVGISSTGMVIVDLPARTVRTEVSTGSTGYFNFIATAPDSQSAWMSQSDLNTIVRVDLTTNQVTATVPVGSYPYGIDVSPTGDMVFVINHGEQTMSRVDTATATEVMPRNPVGIYPMGVLAHSGGTVLAVNCISGNVSQHDPATGGQIGVFTVGSEPVNIDEAPGGDVSVANTFSSSISIIDVSAGTRVDVSVGGSVTGLASK